MYLNGFYWVNEKLILASVLRKDSPRQKHTQLKTPFILGGRESKTHF